MPWYQVLDSSVPATAFCPNPQQHMVPALGSVVWSAQGCSCLISSSGQNLLSGWQSQPWQHRDDEGSSLLLLGFSGYLFMQLLIFCWDAGPQGK